MNVCFRRYLTLVVLCFIGEAIAAKSSQSLQATSVASVEPCEIAVSQPSFRENSSCIVDIANIPSMNLTTPASVFALMGRLGDKEALIMRGDGSLLKEARIAASGIKEPYLWFSNGGIEYVILDKGLIAKALNLYAPVERRKNELTRAQLATIEKQLNAQVTALESEIGDGAVSAENKGSSHPKNAESEEASFARLEAVTLVKIQQLLNSSIASGEAKRITGREHVE